MKLNKVLSIALSGVLAVGLLAGCGTSYDIESAEFAEKLTISGASTPTNGGVLGNTAGNVVWKYMNDEDTEIKTVTDGYSEALTEMAATDNSWTAMGKTTASTDIAKSTAEGTVVYVKGYTYKASSSVTAETVAQSVSTDLASLSLNSTDTTVEKATVSYNVYVSCQKATDSDDNAAWFALVVIEQVTAK